LIHSTFLITITPASVAYRYIDFIRELSGRFFEVDIALKRGIVCDGYRPTPPLGGTTGSPWNWIIGSWVAYPWFEFVYCFGTLPVLVSNEN
jgi:hypothetical protein